MGQLRSLIEQDDAAGRAFLGAFFDSLRPWSRTLTREEVTAEAGIAVGSDLASRNVATSRMADLLGAPTLVARSQNVTLTHAGEVRKGIVMGGAPGTQMGKLPAAERAVQMRRPEVLRDLSSLQLLDFICGQVDRHPNNYFVNTDTGHITGIDNDLAFGTIVNGVLKLDQIISPAGDLLIPYIDQDVAASIMALDSRVLAHTFCDLLSRDEMRALITRTEKLARAVQRLVLDHPERILHRDQWEGNDDVPAAFNGAAGNLSFYRT